VTLDKQKNLNWTEILKKAPGAPAVAPHKGGPSAATPMDVQLARLSLDGIEVGIGDQSPETPVRLDIVKGFVTLKNLRLDMVKAVPLKELALQRKDDVPLEAGFALKQGGRFDVRGTLIVSKRSGRLDLKLAGLSLIGKAGRTSCLPARHRTPAHHRRQCGIRRPFADAAVRHARARPRRCRHRTVDRPVDHRAGRA
jgi:hypothetical protein